MPIANLTFRKTIHTEIEGEFVTGSKKIILTSLLACLGFGFPSCSDTQLGIGVGAIVGGIIGHSGNRDHGGHRHGRRGGGRFGRYSEVARMTVDDRNDLLNESRDEDIEFVAQKYGIPTEASLTLVDSLYKANSKDFSGLRNLGLEDKDLLAIYNNQFPSELALTKVSQNLNMNAHETALLIENITVDVQFQKAQSASDQN